MGKEEQRPLLSRAEGNGYGATGYTTKSGYTTSPEGLGNLVQQTQFGFLDAFGGTAELAKAIGCERPAEGLKESFDFASQRAKFGSNALELPPEPSLFALLAEGAQDVTLVMLICSALVSLFLGLVVERDFDHGWIEGVSILVTVAVVLNVAALTDYFKAKDFRQQQIDLDNQKKINVVRGGKTKSIHPRDLVVGDVVRLAVGDILPADGILVEGADLRFDESALTGETNLISKGVYDGSSKKKEDPFVVSGTNVMHGSGKMVVTAVGKNSIQGKILARLREVKESSDGGQESHDGSSVDLESQRVEKSSGCFSAFLASLKSFFTFGAGDDGGDLMEKLDVLAVDIGKAGMIVAVLVFFVMITSWISEEWINQGECGKVSSKGACSSLRSCTFVDGVCERSWSAEDLSTILKFFITAITILVVAVPEGLPLAVTLSLAISMRRMTKDNNQVKHMDSCETMGSATTICSDKTGTLTENKMTVMRAFIGCKEYVHRAGSDTNSIAQVVQKSRTPKQVLRLLCEGIVLDSSSTSRVVMKSGAWAYEGNATECALLKLASELGYEQDLLRKSYKEPNSTADWGVFSIPFSSERKRMSWVVKEKNIDVQMPSAPYRMFTKGAPQQVIDSSSKILDQSNTSDDKISIRDLNDQDRQTLMDKVSEYQKAGMRTLALGYRDFDKEPKGGWEREKDKLEHGIILLGLFGIEDPLRQSVPHAIAQCRKAGIDVRMCTGDALATAVAIAKQCGILRSSDFGSDGVPKKNFAMVGAEFDDRVHKKDPNAKKIIRRVYDPESGESKDMLAEPFLKDNRGEKIIDQTAFDDIWPTLRVLARCQPEDKLTLVRGMRQSKVFLDKARCASLKREHNINIFPDFQVVAVTGDGTNDAPALKSADVGFAMGVVGTETAKQACDILLLDDNFTSIVKAVMWGRNVFDSISKFIQFQLTVNFVAIILAVVGAFTYNESPLSAVQMLWVNMIMDSLASLALATELPTENLLDRPPYGKRRGVITGVMLANIIGHGVYQLAVLFTVLFWPQVIPLSDPITYEPKPASLHWSLFFNVFVLLQLFNELNSRRLQDLLRLKTSWSEWNVFDGIFSNVMFVIVVGSTFILQVLMVQYGGAAVNLVRGGLSSEQWLFCLGVGAFSLIWQWVINIFLLIFMPQEPISKPPTKAESFRVPPPKIRTKNAKNNWQKARLGIRRSRVYARAFGLSLRSGVRLNTWIETSDDVERRQESFTQIARQLSSQFSCT